MRVDYIHGNPRKVTKKLSKGFSIKKPTLAQIKKVWGENAAKKLSNPAKKSIKKVAAKVAPKKIATKSIKKSQKPTSSKITLEEAKQLFGSTNKPSQGGSAMAKKQRSAAQKAATKKLVAMNKAKKAGKKTAKKAHKKAHKTVKRVAAKKAHKIVKKSSAKKAHSRKKVAKKRTTGSSALRHAVAMRHGKATGHKSKGKKSIYTRHGSTKSTKMPMPARLLRRGEEVDGVFERTVKKGKRKIKKNYLAKIIRTNPKKKKHMKRKKRNPIVVSANPRRKHKKHSKKHTRRNPIVVSRNPRSVSFMKNPMGSMIAAESKFLNSLAPIDNNLKKFLNIGVLEAAGLAVGAGLDGSMLQVVKMIPSSDKVLAHIPAEYQAPAVSATFGLALHLVNSLIAKKSGKKSVILEELSKGMIAASLVKAIASMSPLSSENDVGLVSTTISGYQYHPNKGMSGIIRSNPSASMKVGNSDFSGADFQGADFQGHSDNVGGADFDGYVQSMGGDDSADYGTDDYSMKGNW